MSDLGDRLKAVLADRYQIEREIGSGGMATVYLARDVKHDRKVAVKTLKPELAAVVGTERFLAEIRTTANLSHPHILPLHESGSADGFLFYVMPYVEGESLRQKLDREHQLGIDDALRIAEQVGSALAYAHSKGIVHRDIKPENVLLQGDQAVVADFGIALAVDSAGGERLTETGLSVGTPAYMSPEQVAGEKEIDSRSDLYSLACVLYEMLAGDPPFTASNPRAVLARHLTDDAPPVTTVRPGVPAPAAAAIGAALRKVPADRPRSASAFVEALFKKEVAGDREQKSIVVLPFENLSPDPDNAYFADGLTEELIAELSGVRALRVISRTSAMQFKDSKKGVPTIAKELDVRYALEGSVRRVGDSVRITAQLIDASTDSHLWAERYTGRLDDIFDLQETLARRIVGALAIELDAGEERSLSERPIENVEAYELYLRARQAVYSVSSEETERARRQLEKALEIVGDNAVLFAQLGNVHYQFWNLGIRLDEEDLRLARDYADRALALDPASADHLWLRGLLEVTGGSAVRALDYLDAALERNPAHAEALGWYPAIAGFIGLDVEAKAKLAELRKVDPLSIFAVFTPIYIELVAGRFMVGLELARLARKTHVADPIIEIAYAFALGLNGRRQEASETLHRFCDSRKDMWSRLGSMLGYAFQHDREGVLHIMDEDFEKWAEKDFWYSQWTALALAQIGELDRALDWLETAVDRGNINYPYLSEYDPFLEPLRGTERFQEIVERARVGWERFRREPR